MLADSGDPSVLNSIATQCRRDDTATGGDPPRDELQTARFQILRPVGRGGLGQVSAAFDRQLDREVAVKEILPGYADDLVHRQKFLLEAQVTGRLEHPGIVPVYAVGSGDDGRPYYAMRLIRGENLGQRTEAFHQQVAEGGEPFEGRQLRSLLRRLIDVCDTVAYAHSRGVLHRDIKPGNIMLGHYGESLVVDWGLAKAIRVPQDAQPTAPGAAEPSGHSPPADRCGPIVHSAAILRPGSEAYETSHGTRLGTPSYAPPEQIEGNIAAVGVRSDVYGIGAVLYHLLCNRPPVVQSPDAIRNATRALSPRLENPAVPRGLDSICRRALAYEPAHRYGSVEAVRGDLQAWLDDEPISVVPDNAVSIATRWIRKHRGAALTLAVSMLLITTLSIVGAVVINDFRRRAEVLAEHETAARVAAQQAQQNADQASRQALRAAGFLAETLRSFDPYESGKAASTTELLDRSLRRLKSEFADDRPTQAKLLHIVGQSLRGIGAYEQAVEALDQALELRRDALGTTHRDTLETMIDKGRAEQKLGHLPPAEQTLREAYTLTRQHLPVDDPVSLAAQHQYASLLMARGGVPRFQHVVDMLEDCYKRRTVVLGPRNRDTLQTLERLVGGYRRLEKIDLAIETALRCAQLREEELGPEHAETLSVLHELGSLYMKQAEPEKAKQVLIRTYRGQNTSLGETSPATLTTLNDLGHAEILLGNPAAGKATLIRCYQLRQTILGPQHPQTLVTSELLGMCHQELGEYEDAKRCFQEMLAGYEAIRGADHNYTLNAIAHLNRLLLEHGNPDEQQQAAAALVHYVLARTANEKVRDSMLCRRFVDVRQQLTAHQEWEGAATVFRTAAELPRRFRTSETEKAEATLQLGNCLWQLRRSEEALSRWLTAREILQPLAHRESPDDQAVRMLTDVHQKLTAAEQERDETEK